MRWFAAAATCALLTACTAETPTITAASTTTSPAPPPVPDNPLDEVVDEEPLDQDGPDGQVHQMLIGSDGEPVVLFRSLDAGPLLVSRRTGDDWMTLRLTNPAFPYLGSGADAADDGTVVAGAFVGDSYALVRITADGGVTLVSVAEPLSPTDDDVVGLAVTPDGGTVYLGVNGQDDERRLLAIDAVTGKLRGEHAFQPDDPGHSRVTGVRVTGDRVLVTVDRAVDDAGDGGTPWLERFELDLRPVDAVQLTDESTSGPQAFVVDNTGTAYVALLVSDPNASIWLVSVGASATSPTPVADFPGETLVDGLAVDPDGEWAYLAGLDNGGDPSDITVTPISLAGGGTEPPIAICPGTAADDLAVTPEGESLLLTASCLGRDVHPTLFTIR
jgi:DNA-binding beta-propeller fold protein YncE